MTKPNLPPGVPEMIEGEKVLWAYIPEKNPKMDVQFWLGIVSGVRGCAGVVGQEGGIINSKPSSGSVKALLADLEAANARADEAEAELASLQEALDGWHVPPEPQVTKSIKAKFTRVEMGAEND